MPAYSQVNGVLPGEALARHDNFGSAIVRAELNVSRAGALEFDIGDAKDVDLWADGKIVGAGEAIELTAGQHSLYARVRLGERAKKGLRVALAPAKGSSAEARFVGGR